MVEPLAIAAAAVWALAFALMSATGLSIFVAFGALVAMAVYHYPRWRRGLLDFFDYPRGRRGSNRPDR